VVGRHLAQETPPYHSAAIAPSCPNPQRGELGLGLPYDANPLSLREKAPFLRPGCLSTPSAASVSSSLGKKKKKLEIWFSESRSHGIPGLQLGVFFQKRAARISQFLRDDSLYMQVQLDTLQDAILTVAIVACCIFLPTVLSIVYRFFRSTTPMQLDAESRRLAYEMGLRDAAKYSQLWLTLTELKEDWNLCAYKGCLKLAGNHHFQVNGCQLLNPGVCEEHLEYDKWVFGLKNEK
jgi:hypothetical protein